MLKEENCTERRWKTIISRDTERKKKKKIISYVKGEFLKANTHTYTYTHILMIVSIEIKTWGLDGRNQHIKSKTIDMRGRIK